MVEACIAKSSGEFDAKGIAKHFGIAKAQQFFTRMRNELYCFPFIILWEPGSGRDSCEMYESCINFVMLVTGAASIHCSSFRIKIP